ncbi:MAG: BCCT family transporter [Proteobacteria bacterium]|nr:BCCT family transporter [Pseudomonadota bacterium]
MPLLFAMHYKRYIVGILAFIGSIFIGWLSLFHTNWLLLYTLFNYIFGYLLLLICVTPAGSIVMGKESDKLPLIQWLGKLFLGQVVLIIFTFAAFTAFILNGPSLAPTNISLAFAQNAILDYTRWMWGIFPWGVYGFWALILAYIVYIKKGQPYFYQLARNLFSKRFDPMIKAYVEGTVNGTTMMAIALVACAIALLFSYAFEARHGVDHFKVPAMTYMILSFFMLFISIKKGQRLFKFITVKSKSYVLFFAFMIIILSVLFMISSYANVWLMKAHAELVRLQCVECRNYFKKIPEEVRFAAIYWGWCMIWVPLAGSYLAQISKGRTIREFVIGLFLLPAILLVIKFHWGLAPFEAILSHVAMWDSTIKYLGLASVAGILFVLVIKHFKDSTLFSSGYLLPDSAKSNRLWLQDASKVKGISKIAQKIALLMMGTLFVHTISGWYGVQVEVLAMGILVLNAAYAGFHLMNIRFLKDRVWLGNRNIPPFD